MRLILKGVLGIFVAHAYAPYCYSTPLDCFTFTSGGSVEGGDVLTLGIPFTGEVVGSAIGLDAGLIHCLEGSGCRSDLDGDGELTIFDFLAFQNAFDAMDPIADFDDDGAFTIFDFLAFQNAFDAGCD